MSKKTGVHRRDFIKLVGAATGMAATGCGERLPEKLIPYVFQPTEVIPGVAAWYAGTCGGCSAGCGWLVRTREGRAVKVEGNTAHPVNKGGLCARGQARLQRLYDPDRIKEPLFRGTNEGAFTRLSWEDAVSKAAEAISKAGDSKKIVLITGPVSASFAALIKELAEAKPSIKHLELDPEPASAMDDASTQVFGEKKRLEYDFSKADCVVNFGADFLASWRSPVRYARDWAAKRNADSPKSMSFVAHVEPRLSLTAANADLWLRNKPGSEAELLFALLREVRSRVKAGAVPASTLSAVDRFLSADSREQSLEGTDISSAKIAELADKLTSARHPLVLADGAAVLSGSGSSAAAAALLTNVLLGAPGSTLFAYDSTPGASTYTEAEFKADLEAKSVEAAIIVNSNPVYTSGSDEIPKALGSIPFIVGLASSLDETALLANVVLPLSSELETWWDSEPAPGVFNLSQPAMQPVYPTQGAGDILLALANALDLRFEGVSSYLDYLKQAWKKRTGESGFDSRWLRYVQHGGDWDNRTPLRTPKFNAANLKSSAPSGRTESGTGLHVAAFPTISGSDGQGADSAWLQELPDPLTTVVWGSWCEMHPDTAKERGVKQGDVLQLKTEFGAIEAPVYLRRQIHPALVAVPLGLGRTQGSRYARGVGAHGAALLPTSGFGTPTDYVVPLSTIRKSVNTEALIVAQGHLSQEKRGLIRERKDHDHHSHDDHGHTDPRFPKHKHHDPHALGSHSKPRQMYEQMEHPGYRWGMSIDLAKCIGCSACVVSCYAENNIPVVGKKFAAEGREMSWLRIDHYEDGPDNRPVNGFMPMLCQHCNNAPCEPVCPVYATYHNEDGLNAMVYNRCVGTRYCSNNCSYKTRRFNWFGYEWPEPMTWQLNPDVTVREVGIMEKCTFCVQRIAEGKNKAKNKGVPVQDGDIQPACASSCPTGAIRFGNLNDKKSAVYKDSHKARAYKVLDAELNTQPAISYLAKAATPGRGHGKA